MKQVLALVLVVAAVGCIKKQATPYSRAVRMRDDGTAAAGVGNHIVTIFVNDATPSSAVKDYAFRRANELCPQGWTSQADLNDLDIDDDADDGDEEGKSLTIDVSCKTLLTIPAQ